MSTPGAATPTNSPDWENCARSLLRSEAATARTPSYEAGYVLLTLPPRPSLPADATTTISRFRASFTASSRSLVGRTASAVSCEMLITSAFLAMACRIAVASVSAVPLPSASFCWMGMITASGARPTNPVPLAGRAAMMPATLVPWPTVSVVPCSLPRFSL